jgi:hypothetical protein
MAATGGLIGYWLTYSDKADYNNEVFQKVITDKDRWHKLAEIMRECAKSPGTQFSEECKKWERAN